MTISTTNVRNDYVGNGAAVTYPYTFKAFTAADLLVYVDGVLQTITTHYSVTGVGANAGGNVVFVTAPTDDIPIAIVASMTLTQTTDLVNESRFFQSRIEDRMDKLCRADQINAEGISRSLRLPVDEAGTTAAVELPSAEDRASKFIGFDADGNLVAVESGPATLDTLTYHVGQYGAVGDGATDDTTAVQAAIAAAPSGATIRFDGSKHYYLTSLGTITKPLTIDGGGCRITCDLTPTDTTGTPLFCFSGSLGTARAAGALAVNASAVTCTTPAHAGDFAIGDIVWITCADTVNKWDNTGTVAVAKGSLHKVFSANIGTGVVQLVEQLDIAMSTSVTIQKVSAVDRPIVRNFTRITEVSPGAHYAGADYEGPNCPSIVDFQYCVEPLAERIYCDGWNMQLVSITYCYGGSAFGIRGERPFFPSWGGSGNVHRIGYSRNVLISHGQSYNARHTVDWYGSVDCASEYNVASFDPSAQDGFAYITHGYLSRRIKSFCDTCVNGNGWAAGNLAYAPDYDITIENFTYSCATSNWSANPMLIYAGVVGVRIINPTIDGQSGAINIKQLADKIHVIGGRVSVRGAFASAITASDASDTKYPIDVTVDGVECHAGSGTVAIGVNLTGHLAIRNCRLYGPTGISACSALACESVDITNNAHYADGTANYSFFICDTFTTGLGYIPTGAVYRVANNSVYGETGESPIRMYGDAKLVCVGNRTSGNTNDSLWLSHTLGWSTNADILVSLGAIVESNGSAKDCPSNLIRRVISGAEDQRKAFQIQTNGLLRWELSANTAETGSDAGMDFALSAFDDSGAIIDNPIYLTRAANGSMTLQRPRIVTGTSALASDASVEIRAAAGYRKRVKFTTGTTDRWEIGSDSTAEGGANAGSLFVIRAYDDAGALIDQPIQIDRASTGWIVANRHVKFANRVGFNNTNPIAKPAVTGSRAGNAALASLLTQLAAYGLITDSSTA